MAGIAVVDTVYRESVYNHVFISLQVAQKVLSRSRGVSSVVPRRVVLPTEGSEIGYDGRNILHDKSQQKEVNKKHEGIPDAEILDSDGMAHRDKDYHQDRNVSHLLNTEPKILPECPDEPTSCRVNIVYAPRIADSGCCPIQDLQHQIGDEEE